MTARANDLHILFDQASRLAVGYSGSRKSWNDFSSTLSRLETAINPALREYGHDISGMKLAPLSSLQRNFLTASGIENPYGIDDLFNLAIEAEQDFTRRALAAQDGILNLPGLNIVVMNSVLVRPDSSKKLETGSGNGKFEDAATSDRTARLLSLLRELDLYNEELVAYIGLPPQGTVRKKPYTIVAIPKRNIEIAVCDEVGNTTLAARPMLGRMAWESLDKTALERHPHVKTVNHHNAEHWRRELTDLILESPEDPLVNTKDYARSERESPRYNPQTIVGWIAEHIRQHGRMPSGDKKDLLPGAPEGETLLKIRGNLAYGTRGLGKFTEAGYDTVPRFTYAVLEGKFDLDATPLREAMAERELTPANLGLTEECMLRRGENDYDPQTLVGWIAGYIRQHGKMPDGKKKDSFPGAPEGETPLKLRGNLTSGVRGLRKFTEAGYDTIHRFTYAALEGKLGLDGTPLRAAMAEHELTPDDLGITEACMLKRPRKKPEPAPAVPQPL